MNTMTEEITKKVDELIELLKNVPEEEVEIEPEGLVLNKKEVLVQEIILKVIKEVCHKHRRDEVLKIIESRLLKKFRE
jgi:hypothetical protein